MSPTKVAIKFASKPIQNVVFASPHCVSINSMMMMEPDAHASAITRRLAATVFVMVSDNMLGWRTLKGTSWKHRSWDAVTKVDLGKTPGNGLGKMGQWLVVDAATLADGKLPRTSLRMTRDEFARKTPPWRFPDVASFHLLGFHRFVTSVRRWMVARAS